MVLEDSFDESFLIAPLRRESLRQCMGRDLDSSSAKDLRCGGLVDSESFVHGINISTSSS